MKFMVEFRVKPGCKEKLMERFEHEGPNRHPGVKFRGAWIGSHSDRVFVLSEAADQSLVESVASSWSEFGSHEIHPVNDIEQY